MTIVYYTQFDKELPENVYAEYIKDLPARLKDKNSRYRRWQDRHAHLFGILLLLEGWSKFGLTRNALNELKYTDHDRPYLDHPIDFNISHSGEYVVCAISDEVRLGIDIERNKEVDFKDFRNVMTDEQWSIINRSEDPMFEFFRFWAIKESVIKADSRGLSIPLLDLHVRRNTIEYDNQIWYLNELKIDEEYCSCLATDKQDIVPELIQMNFSG